MSIKKNSSHTGYRWRDELVSKLLSSESEEIDRNALNNIVRGYVPMFFPAKLPESGSAPWLWPYLGSRDYWWETEIVEIGKDFAEKSDRLDGHCIKKIFRKHGWSIEEPVEGISVGDKVGEWRYDGYKDRVAVEVELSSRTQVFKDAFKFLIGQAMNQIDVGIVMVREHLEKEGNPYLKSVGRDWHAIYTTLPMLKMAFYGFPNKPNSRDSLSSVSKSS